MIGLEWNILLKLGWFLGYPILGNLHIVNGMV